MKSIAISNLMFLSDWFMLITWSLEVAMKFLMFLLLIGTMIYFVKGL